MAQLRCKPSRAVHFALTLAVGVVTAFTVPATAGPVAGAGSCGGDVNRAPSTLGGCSGGGMVNQAQCLASLVNFKNSVGCLINAERTSRGLPALTESASLSKAALGHTSDAQRLKWWTGGANPHVNPETKSTIESRIKAAGYCGGNPRRTTEIAYTWAGDQASPVGAVNWWMNISKFGHREAILDPEIKELGIGISGQVVDKAVQPQALMGAYVINFGACQ